MPLGGVGLEADRSGRPERLPIRRRAQPAAAKQISMNPNSGRTKSLLTVVSAIALAVVPARSLAEVPPEAQPTFNKGVLAAHQQEWNVAFKSFMDAHKFFRGSPEINYNLGLTESKIPGRELRAIAWLAAYLAADPNAPNASAVKTEILALLIKNEGNNDRFVEVAKQAAEQVPEEEQANGKEHALSEIYLLYVHEGEEAKAASLAREAHLEGPYLPTSDPNFDYLAGATGASVSDWVNELDDGYDGLNRPEYLDLPEYVASATAPRPAVLAELHTSAMSWAADKLASTAHGLLAKRRRITNMLNQQFGAGFVR
jgi:hypothetical protein